MSDMYKVYVDGTEYQIPSWATEEQLKVVTKHFKDSVTVSKLIAKGLKDKNIDTSRISQAIQDTAGAYNKAVDQETKRQKKEWANKVKETAQTSMNVIDKFSNTDAPLTSMIDIAGDLGGALSGATDGVGKSSKSSSLIAKALKKVAPGISAVGSAGLAWAGFQAGQLEQFAKAQETMIDVGSIFHDGDTPFENLKQHALRSGITYTQLTKVVSENSLAMQSLGDGVSGGTSAFAKMFRQVNVAGNQFGDYGMRSAQMAEVLADYVNVQRMTTSKDMALASTQDSVKQGFHNLMVESTALANLTGKNRSEILQKQMSALTEPQVAAALTIMEKAGTGHADVARSLVKQFAVIGDEMGPLGQEMSSRFNSYIMSIADAPQDFNLRTAFMDNPALLTAIEEGNKGMIDRINNVFRSGDTEAANRLLFKELSKFKDAELGTSTAQAGTQLDFIKQLHAGGVLVDKHLKKIANMTEQEYDEHIKKTEEKLKESGSMTTAMNEMTKSFIGIQDAFVLNLDDASAMAENLATGLREGVDKFREILDGDSERVEGNASNIAYPTPMANDIKSHRAVKMYDEIPFDEKWISDNAKKIGEEGSDSRYAWSATGAWIIDHDKKTKMKSSNKIEARASGGPVSVNTPYIVGERGPELFVPPSNGQIISNNNTKKIIDNQQPDISNMQSNEAIEDIIAIREASIQTMKQLTQVMKTIKRSKDYQRAVDGGA